MTFIEVDICHRIANVGLRDLDPRFHGQPFSCHAFATKKLMQAVDVPGKYLSTRTAIAVELLLLYIQLLNLRFTMSVALLTRVGQFNV